MGYSRPVRDAARALLCGGIVACGSSGTGPGSDGRALYHPAPASNAIADRFVVLFESGVADVAGAAADLASLSGGDVLILYDDELRGFAARVPAGGLDRLRDDDRVDAVYQDGWLAFAASAGDPQTQQMDAVGDPWGLDRIDQDDHPLDRQYTYVATGSGVTVYVIDSGVDPGHADLEGRAHSERLTVEPRSCPEDELGHGTAVASIVAGKTHGVAKAADVVGLAVAPCGDVRPLFSLVLKAVSWVAHAPNRSAPAVVNLSLGWRMQGTFDPWRVLIEDLVQRTVDQGVTYVVSAGNFLADACGFWPARLGGTITVAGTIKNDTRTIDSNFGPCVDLFAPGDDILAALAGGGTSHRKGTSFAAPHVTGAAALLLEGTPTLDPAAVKSALVARATTGRVREAREGSPNRLLRVN